MTTESVRMFSRCTQTFMNANAIRHRCVVHRESVISMRFVRELICKRTQQPKIIRKTHIKREEIENEPHKYCNFSAMRNAFFANEKRIENAPDIARLLIAHQKNLEKLPKKTRIENVRR